MKTQSNTDYSHFTVSEWMEEDDFIRWVLHPDAENNRFWKDFMDKNPQKVEDMEAARKLILQLVSEKRISNPEAKNRVWLRLQRSITRNESKRKMSVLRSWKAVAAVFIGLLLTTGYFTWKTLQPVKIHTAYGEIRTIELPDHSLVTLNANSTISFNKDWEDSKLREIRLEGEAFFDVSDLSGAIHKPFVVRTGNVKVEVLGTSFNVDNRHEKTTVVLKSGKVRLAFKGKDQQDMLMEPGEKVSYTDNQITKSRIEVSHYTSWKNKKWKFDNTPLRDIIKQLQDNYGLKVILQDTSLASKTMSGTLSSINKEVLLNGISTVLGLHIEKVDEHTIVITK